MCSARVQTQKKNDIWTFSKQKEDRKETRGKLVTAATVDVRVFFFHFFCEKCSKLKNEKKRGKRRTKQVLFENNFQNEATLVMENKKANTWQACYSRHH